MRKACFKVATFALGSCIALAGCNASSAIPSATVPNISGDYSGTIQDGQGGSGTATGTLAQHGASAGGAITDTEAAQTITGDLSVTITPSYAYSGTMVIDYPSGTTCTFHTTGSYVNGSGGWGLNGSYKAVTNCSGDTGTYTLTQQCTDTVTSARRRPESFPAAC